MSFSFSFPRRSGQRLLLAAILLGLVGVTARAAAAQAGGATLRSEPATLEVGAGQVETLQLILDDAVDVYGIEIRASFDPSVAEVADADPGKAGVQMIPGDFIKPDFLVRNTADNEAGTLQYVITQVNPTEPVSGSGVVLSIMFLGKEEGGQADLVIDFVDIVDRRGVKLEVSAQDGVLAVVAPKPPTPTPVPTAAPSATPGSSIAAAATPPASGGPAGASATAIAPTTAPETQAASGLSRGEIVAIGVSLFVGIVGCVGAVVLLGVAFMILGFAPSKKEQE